MYKLLIFGGTTEGRKLIEYLKDKNIKIIGGVNRCGFIKKH